MSSHRPGSITRGRRWGSLVAVASVTVLATCILINPGVASGVAPAGWADLASDTFSRTNPAGWGTAVLGGSWTLDRGTAAGAEQFSVTPEAASVKVQPGTAAEADLMTVAQADVQATTTFSLPAVTASAFGIYQSIQARLQSDGSAYRASIKVGNGGKTSLSLSRLSGGVSVALSNLALSFMVAPKAAVTVQMYVTGSNPVTVSARAWPAGTIQPGWQSTVADSATSRLTKAGAVGLWTYTSSAAAATVVTTSAFTAWKPAPATHPTTSLPTTTAPPTSSTTSAPNTTNTATTPPPPVTLPDRGSATVGTTAYAIPAGAIFVSVNSGSDSNSGSLAGPLKTIAAAERIAPAGRTIVLRAGTYNESVIVDKTLTIQAYPHEAVWMDGSVTVSNWTKSGTSWLSTGWTTTFDRSTSYTEGDTGNRLLQPAYPLASWPDQVFIDGAQLTQVSTASHVVAGTFFVDYSAHTLRIGSDPTNHQVRSSNKAQAIYATGANVTLQGFGIRRYGTPIPDAGAVRMGKAGNTVRNLVFSDNATIGLSIRGTDSTVDHVTVLNSGMLGIGGTAAYSSVIENSVVQYNNSQHFKPAPVSGGIKIARSRGLDILNNNVSGNDSAGIWCDESCYDVNVANNVVDNNSTTGIQLELSDTAVIANNHATGNNIGIQIINTGNVRIFNNEVGASTQYGVKLAQDTRRNSDTSLTGHDPQRPNPDSTVPWIIRNVTLSNNVFATGGMYQFFALDGKSNISADAMKITINGNLFIRWSASGQTRMVGWGGGDNVTVTHYPNPEALAAAKNPNWQNAATGQLPLSAMVPAKTANASIAVPLPADVAALVGQATGAKLLGLF